jgi:hypothetical protein
MRVTLKTELTLKPTAGVTPESRLKATAMVTVTGEPGQTAMTTREELESLPLKRCRRRTREDEDEDEDAVAETLAALDIATMTPLEALNTLHNLQREIDD